MKLSLVNRIILSSSLPKEGKFETLIILEDVKNKVKITQEELAEYEIKSLETGGLSWNEKGVSAELEVTFTEAEKGEIVKILKKMSEEEKLTTDHVPLYKLFV